MAVTLCKLKWLSQLLLDLRVFAPRPIPLYCDSQAAIHIIANLYFYECTMHIKIDCHFIRNAFQFGYISPHYLCSDLQPAYVLTKAIQTSDF